MKFCRVLDVFLSEPLYTAAYIITHASVSLLHLWATVMDSGGSVRTVFVDFQKVFDRVDHNIVLQKVVQRDVRILLSSGCFPSYKVARSM